MKYGLYAYGFVHGYRGKIAQNLSKLLFGCIHQVTDEFIVLRD